VRQIQQRWLTESSPAWNRGGVSANPKNLFAHQSAGRFNDSARVLYRGGLRQTILNETSRYYRAGWLLEEPQVQYLADGGKKSSKLIHGTDATYQRLQYSLTDGRNKK